MIVHCRFQVDCELHLGGGMMGEVRVKTRVGVVLMSTK